MNWLGYYYMAWLGREDMRIDGSRLPQGLHVVFFHSLYCSYRFFFGIVFAVEESLSMFIFLLLQIP